MLKQVKIIVEKHSDGYVAYPLGLKGVVVGEGETFEEAYGSGESRWDPNSAHAAEPSDDKRVDVANDTDASRNIKR